MAEEEKISCLTVSLKYEKKKQKQLNEIQK